LVGGAGASFISRHPPPKYAPPLRHLPLQSLPLHICVVFSLHHSLPLSLFPSQLFILILINDFNGFWFNVHCNNSGRHILFVGCELQPTGES
jgi:hypothetical protein